MHPWVISGRPIPAAPVLVTSRTLTETIGSPIPAGIIFRFGLGLQRGSVASGQSILLKDGAGNTLLSQFDAINHWPDGSVRWCEVRGGTARTINAGSSDTVSIYSVSGPFNNTLPAGKTP